MSMDRRKFLKIAGISSILGLGATAASATHNLWVKGLGPEEVDKNKEALLAKRWAMVVDMSKFKTEDDYKKTIDACHQVHNVPDYRNADGSVDKKFEIKWIWTSPYERAFPGQENKYMSEHIKDMPFIVACNHCDHRLRRAILRDGVRCCRDRDRGAHLGWSGQVRRVLFLHRAAAGEGQRGKRGGVTSECGVKHIEFPAARARRPSSDHPSPRN